jgi:SPP1 family predicted phage head-tail adaptor
MKWPKINPGSIARHQLAFYSRTITKSETTGADTATWDTLFARVAGELNPKDGRKFFDAARFTTERLTTAAIRYQAGYDETMQVEVSSRRYEILEILDEQELHVRLVLLLRELE